MEIRVKNVIVNVDVPIMAEHDKAFVEQQANIIVGYFRCNAHLKRVMHIMMADAGVTLAKLSLLQDMENTKGKDDIDGGV